MGAQHTVSGFSPHKWFLSKEAMMALAVRVVAIVSVASYRCSEDVHKGWWQGALTASCDKSVGQISWKFPSPMKALFVR